MRPLPTPEEFRAAAKRLTPWELRQGLWMKREDLFTPLGPGGVNGSKLRQLGWLFENRPRGARRVITAASALSPQHCMTAVLSRIHGLPSHHVTAAEPSRHPSTEIARLMGATFTRTAVGYNPALQSSLKKLQTEEDFVVPYGITTEAANELAPFHAVGAAQVINLPEAVETLVVPFGSGNSLTSIICGLLWHGRKNLRVLRTVAIGPDRVKWVTGRLWRMGIEADHLPFEWDGGTSLHETGYASYGDRMPETYDGAVMHPTYEAKIVRWAKENGELGKWQDGKTAFWVVGSEPKVEAHRAFTSPGVGA